MRAMDRVVRSIFAISIGGLSLARCGSDARAPTHVGRERMVVIDDARIGTGDERFSSFGNWEHAHVNDGRSDGTSTRSFHTGDVLSATFRGRTITLYAVLGPTNGFALVSVDDDPPDAVDFYAPQKRPRVPVWHRTGMSNKTHMIVISVLGRHRPASRGNYVNVDDIVVGIPER
jgi:hypothetical protein